MATYALNSHSLRVSKRASLRIETAQPVTPVHSPHHSVTSSVSYRTPNHTLTIHEYRKQQQTPVSHSETPPGKTLRRKAALSSLGEVERVPSVTRATSTIPSPAWRPLHFSQSAAQLNTNPPPLQQSSFSALALRSQSAEPYIQGGSISSTQSANLQGKVRYFKSRKRLPKPPAANGSLPIPPLLANVTFANARGSPLHAKPSFSPESFQSSDAHNTTTSSTFSLSQFPKPPHLIDLSFSPPRDEDDLSNINAFTFATTAPETPPATPAIIHYRGVSFDLVNPHASLLLHDIVTPTREYESSEYLPLQSAEEPLLASSEMAPKRPLYGDVNSARAGIMRRVEDSFDENHPDLPMPPVPAAVTPNSSSYTSPVYSPEPVHVPSPLAITKTANPSRFSLKQLTRTLTKKLGVSAFEDHELREIRKSSVSLASFDDDDDQYTQKLSNVQTTVPKPAYNPFNPMSPITPTSPVFPEGLDRTAFEQAEDQFEEQNLSGYQHVEPLTSMVPDDPSVQMGRMGDSQSTLTGKDVSKPYYEDVESLYASSSVYTRDDQTKADYRQSLASRRQNNPFARYGEVDTSGFENARDSLYSYDHVPRTFETTSTAITTDLHHPSDNPEDPDTISKLIENYRPHDLSTHSYSGQRRQHTSSHKRFASRSDSSDDFDTIEPPFSAIDTYGTGGFLSDTFQMEQQHDQYEVADAVPDIPIRSHLRTRDIGAPPREMAPLAPPFEYDDIPFLNRSYELTQALSYDSSCSYSDTRNVLQISHFEPPVAHVPTLGLQPSSSYSQPEGPINSSSPRSQVADASPRLSMEALSQAEEIFENARAESELQGNEIPAIWARPSSADFFRSKKFINDSDQETPEPERYSVTVEEGDKAEWETLAEDSQDGRASLDDIAGYSSGPYEAIEMQPLGSLPGVNQNRPRQVSKLNFPTPVRSPLQNSASSVPEFSIRANDSTPPRTFSPSLASSPPISKTAPLFHRPANAIGKTAVSDPSESTRWPNPYALSEKETMELLASGPNEEVLIESKFRPSDLYAPVRQVNQGPIDAQNLSSTGDMIEDSMELERENTFEKFSVVGPRGNLTGTPQGTGMHQTGSSVANVSSPPSRLSSSVDRPGFQSNYNGFYATQSPATSSITRIHNSQAVPVAEEPALEPKRAYPTIFLRGPDGMEAIEVTKELPSQAQRQPSQNSPNSQRTRRTSRPSVQGQTKLREMVLASDVRSTPSSQETTFSRFIEAGRPSISDTISPLRPTHDNSVGTTPPTARTPVAHQHSPHLLSPEQAFKREDELRQEKLSWCIFVVLCFVPPFMLLHAILGDKIITHLTNGHLQKCTRRSKKFALIAGLTVNVGVAMAILVPVFIAYAVKEG